MSGRIRPPSIGTSMDSNQVKYILNRNAWGKRKVIDFLREGGLDPVAICTSALSGSRASREEVDVLGKIDNLCAEFMRAKLQLSENLSLISIKKPLVITTNKGVCDQSQLDDEENIAGWICSPDQLASFVKRAQEFSEAIRQKFFQDPGAAALVSQFSQTPPLRVPSAEDGLIVGRPDLEGSGVLVSSPLSVATPGPASLQQTPKPASLYRSALDLTIEATLEGGISFGTPDDGAQVQRAPMARSLPTESSALRSARAYLARRASSLGGDQSRTPSVEGLPGKRRQKQEVSLGGTSVFMPVIQQPPALGGSFVKVEGEGGSAPNQQALSGPSLDPKKDPELRKDSGQGAPPLPVPSSRAGSQSREDPFENINWDEVEEIHLQQPQNGRSE